MSEKIKAVLKNIWENLLKIKSYRENFKEILRKYVKILKILGESVVKFVIIKKKFIKTISKI